MIIERIDETRLMIMLEPHDMDSLDLTYDKVSWKNQKFKLLIAKLLALAKFKTGFSVENSKLSIETLPQGECCVIIFTLFPEIQAEPDEFKTIDFNNTSVSEPYVYKIDNGNDLMEVCIRLNKLRKSNIRSSTVFNSSGQYFILIHPKKDSLPESVSVILSEYGNQMRYSRTLESYLYEATKIVHKQDAISHIGGYCN